MECDAGIILEDLDNRLASEGYMVPLDLGAKGSCLIGGNISTAAGGLRMIRFGSLHNHVLGLQAVRTVPILIFLIVQIYITRPETLPSMLLSLSFQQEPMYYSINLLTRQKFF